ncbi:MAG: hypothetical protein R3B41_02915 [Candidatus Doudnabacteria bacterium]
MKTIFGFSTGCLFKIDLDINQKIEAIINLGVNAIELGYVSGHTLIDQPLESIDVNLLQNFDYVSVHAPTKNFDYQDTSARQSFFAQLEQLNKKHKIDLVVFHPNSFTDLSVLNELKLPFAIENLDARNQTFTSTKEFAQVLEKFPNWKIVLDTQHCFTHDPTMALSKEFQTQFGDQITEIQVSGFTGHHTTLFNQPEQTIIMDYTPLNYPIISESVVEKLEDLEVESNYIKNYLNIN